LALLTTQQLLEVRKVLTREFSAFLTEIPITKAEADAVLAEIDVQLNAAETSTFQALTAGAAKTWLQQNQSLGRRFMEEVLRKRKEEL